MAIENDSGRRQRVLELFAGIGGFAAACPAADIVAAIDINSVAADVYRQNFSHPYHIREVESLQTKHLLSWQADLWWMSPPCQPFSRRGLRQDDDDPRTRGLLRLIDALDVCRPAAIALENVVGFERSRTCEKLLARLQSLGYHSSLRQLCPSQLGWPNRRPRVYLLAAAQPLTPWRELPNLKMRLEELVQREADLLDELWLPTQDQGRYWAAMDRIETLDGQPSTACFASSYGKSVVRSGSYLRVPSPQAERRYRRFSPREVARLLGFDDSYRLDGLANATAWRLLGNSVSLPAVRYVMQHVC